MRRLSLRRGVVVGGGLLLLIGGTALAYQWPSSDGQLHACAQKQSGSLRLLPSGDSCRNDEVPVAWNIQGPAGPQGPQGPAGQGTGGRVWKDATGAVVPIVDRGTPVEVDGGHMVVDTFVFLDSNQIAWAFSPQSTPTVSPVYSAPLQWGFPMLPALFYASADCSGPAYVESNVFFQSRAAYAMGPEIRVLADNAQVTTLTVGSYQQYESSLTANDGFCQPLTDTRSVYALTSTNVITTVPDFPYVLPLHVEIGQ